MRPEKNESASAACCSPSPAESVQIFVATKASSRRSPSADPSASSASPYIGDESNTRAPAARAASVSSRGRRWRVNRCHVPIPTTGSSGPPSPRGRSSMRLEAGGVPRDVAVRRAPLVAPARSALAARARRRGVEAQAGDDRVGVAAVRVDRDPRALARPAPALEPGRVERLRDEPAAVQRVADGARAVVARVLPLAVAAAVAVGLRGDPVGRGDRVLDLLWGVARGDGGAAVARDVRLAGGSASRTARRLRAVAAALVALVAGAARVVGLLSTAGRRGRLLRGALDETLVGGGGAAVGAQRVRALERLDAGGGPAAVLTVGAGADSRAREVGLKLLDVAAVRADAQCALRVAGIGGRRDREDEKGGRGYAKPSGTR